MKKISTLILFSFVLTNCSYTRHYTPDKVYELRLHYNKPNNDNSVKELSYNNGAEAFKTIGTGILVIGILVVIARLVNAPRNTKVQKCIDKNTSSDYYRPTHYKETVKYCKKVYGYEG